MRAVQTSRIDRMTDNSEPFDYEPLTHQRPRSANFVDEIDNGFAKPASWGAAEPTRRAFEPAKPTPELPLNTASETPVSRRSHALSLRLLRLHKSTSNRAYLSYAGILFSLALYFHPTSGAHRWVALFNLLIAAATVAIFLFPQPGSREMCFARKKLF